MLLKRATVGHYREYCTDALSRSQVAATLEDRTPVDSFHLRVSISNEISGLDRMSVFRDGNLSNDRQGTHCSDVIMSGMTSQTTSLTSVYSTVYSGADQRNNQSSTSLAFARGIHRWPVNPPHKGPVTRKMFPFGDVMMPNMCLVSASYFIVLHTLNTPGHWTYF